MMATTLQQHSVTMITQQHQAALHQLETTILVVEVSQLRQ